MDEIVVVKDEEWCRAEEKEDLKGENGGLSALALRDLWRLQEFLQLKKESAISTNLIKSDFTSMNLKKTKYCTRKMKTNAESRLTFSFKSRDPRRIFNRCTYSKASRSGNRDHISREASWQTPQRSEFRNLRSRKTNCFDTVEPRLARCSSFSRSSSQRTHRTKFPARNHKKLIAASRTVILRS